MQSTAEAKWHIIIDIELINLFLNISLTLGPFFTFFAMFSSVLDPYKTFYRRRLNSELYSNKLIVSQNIQHHLFVLLVILLPKFFGRKFCSFRLNE